jgi:hypothetical protein
MPRNVRTLRTLVPIVTWDVALAACIGHLVVHVEMLAFIYVTPEESSTAKAGKGGRETILMPRCASQIRTDSCLEPPVHTLDFLFTHNTINRWSVDVEQSCALRSDRPKSQVSTIKMSRCGLCRIGWKCVWYTLEQRIFTYLCKVRFCKKRKIPARVPHCFTYK